jgi:hypothetical protein
MATINYPKIYSSFTKNLPDKTKEVFSRRFGVGQKNGETLESIGKSMNITRERVRQIEKAGFIYIKNEKKDVLDRLFKDFSVYFENQGGFKKEELALAGLGGKNYQPYILFLLNLGDQFSKIYGKRDFHSFWTILPNKEEVIKKTLTSLVSDLKKTNSPLFKKDFVSQFGAKYNLDPGVILSYIEISKNIKENSEGKIGLVEWPEINPRGVKDKSFLVFKKEQKPLHFTRVASLIDDLKYNLPNKKTLPQTVHNELIKDPRFILVGRGMYALKEWGYTPGTVKDVLIKIMEEANQPIEKDTLVEKVLAQHIVAKNTVLMNLNDKDYFLKDDKGKYILRKTQTA